MITRCAPISAIVNADRASPVSLYWILLVLEFSSDESPPPPRAEVASVRMVDEPWRVAWMIVDRSSLVEISVDDDEDEEVDDMMIFVLVFLDLGVWRRTKADDNDREENERPIKKRCTAAQ